MELLMLTIDNVWSHIITIAQLFDFFLDTLLKSSSKNLKLSDEILEHYNRNQVEKNLPI